MGKRKRQSRPQMSKSERETLKVMRELQSFHFVKPDRKDQVLLERKIAKALSSE